MSEVCPLKLSELQPSQLMISEKKLAAVEKWFSPDRLDEFSPIPVMMLDGVPVMTDGHTRAAAALRAGLDAVPLVWDTDDWLDPGLYRKCVAECRRRGIFSPADLKDRIVSEDVYAEKWDKWCDWIRSEPFFLELEDNEWPDNGTDHDREIVRAIVFDKNGDLFFVRASRDDDFGRAVLIETSGGGVEKGENLRDALLRELREELGAEAEILGELGTVSDRYNLIRRHNINHYFLCFARAFGKGSLTEDEKNVFHLSTLKLRYDEALEEYGKRSETPLGRLIANRELPVLRAAGEIIPMYL